jgi:hypothetical protein
MASIARYVTESPKTLKFSNATTGAFTLPYRVFENMPFPGIFPSTFLAVAWLVFFYPRYLSYSLSWLRERRFCRLRSWRKRWPRILPWPRVGLYLRSGRLVASCEVKDAP